jgi:hypothetical protein
MIVYMSGAENIPCMDFVLSEKGAKNEEGHAGTDPYVKLFAKTADGTKGAEAMYPVRNQNRHPMWNSARNLGEVEIKAGKAVEGTKVCLEMWDADTGSADDFIGGVEVDVSKLSFGTPTPQVLQDTEKKALETKLYMCLLPPPKAKKTVFFIRHGESTWNEAQDGLTKNKQIGNLGTMAESRDNPLSATGITQVRTLQTRVDTVAKDMSKATPGEKKLHGGDDGVDVPPHPRGADGAHRRQERLLKSGRCEADA